MEVERLKAEILDAIGQIRDVQDLETVRVKYLGRKGELTGLLRQLGQLPPEERRVLGQEVNRLRELAEARLAAREEELGRQQEEMRLVAETVDVTLPGRGGWQGSEHPLNLVLEEIQDIFLHLGFAIAEGPEVEWDYYNFEALNLPKDHPAREMHDSLYITQEMLLRTHTSPVQARTMEKQAPELPVRIIAPGRVYRRDALDANHSPVFTQIEGLVVDQGVSFADLKGTLLQFIQRFFGEDRLTRFRPSYFPFTEPSAELDVSCGLCGGKGCRACGQSGWLEVLGCGSVHPHVLQMSHYDPEKVTGFAFGMGVERLAKLKYGIDDIRLFYENDLRFLRQFRKE